MMKSTLYSRTSDVPPRILSHSEVERIVDVIRNAEDAQQGKTWIIVQSWWNGELRWARNKAALSSDRRDIKVSVTRSIDGGIGKTSTNQTDPLSLRSMVAAANRSARAVMSRERLEMSTRPPELPVPTPQIWSDATYNLSVDQRAKLGKVLSVDAEAQGLLSSGYIETRASELARLDADAFDPHKIMYSTFTQAQCSMTVRHPKGVGSGWAGLSSFDWSAIQGESLAATALDKCVRSLNPVSIEPGRYTVVLEPQAVADIFEFLFAMLNKRDVAEAGGGPFPLGEDRSLGIIRTKLGLKVMDERISVVHDPADPMLGTIPELGMEPITWIRNGVLQTLSYFREYALTRLNENLPRHARLAYRVTGGTTSIDEMIASTKRGLLVTRLSNSMLIDQHSLLTTGFTRDGLWLIENGTISKAVKNLRYTESPLFALNQVESLGPPVPVFRPIPSPYHPDLSPAIVPPVKANDFSFTATIDAI